MVDLVDLQQQRLNDVVSNLMRRISKVADSSQYCLLRPISASAARLAGVDPAAFPVYVVDEMERFVVSAELLNHPIFVKLLNKSAQEYGYEQQGVLRIPRNVFVFVFVFERVLETLRCGGETRDLQELLSDEF